MTIATLDLPCADLFPRAPRPSLRPRALPEPLPELTEEQWAEIQARIRATGTPVEVQDDRALVQTFGVAGMLGVAFTALAACGLWSLVA